ncbi:sensor histidine kinase [Segetibacter sp. 3557_3]|uniref:ATP-binding protein n=1 Tax=Segetibacter sp. 3557_3 TaxID=2547429 RepID=UPI001058C2A5|nr:ATP-binding protein [Segetibacter sp. 3557_3]TDH27389.1 sensor histidine kinase [Segetibacter sp. 3557_3]
MASDENSSFVEKMSGKIIIAFALVLLSLGVVWVVNNLAFNKISTIVSDLSTPNEKLLLSRKLFIDVSNLPHLQRLQVMAGKRKPSESFTNQTRRINTTINQLGALLVNVPAQKKRVDSIGRLMRLSNKLFANYLRLGYNIGQRRAFERELNAISAQMDSDRVEVDTNVVTREKKVKTTTIIHPDTSRKIKPKKSWLKRIFTKEKKDTTVLATAPAPKVIIEEESSTTIDTLAVTKQDTNLAELGSSLRRIEKGRLKSTEMLRESEQELIKANDILIHRLLGILNEVEQEEMALVKEQTTTTTELAADTIALTRWITIIFIVLAIVLTWLLLADVARSRSYRKQLELAKNEAEYHSMAKQRFLTNMSHEIRTPLQSIIGYTEQQLLENGDGNKSAVKAVYSSSQHLLQIVNEVLDYSRITSGKLTFENNPFSITDVVNEVSSGLELLAEKKGLQLNVEVKNTETEWLLGDRFRLKQVLYNLLGNAIKFTESGSVTLSVTGLKDGDMGRFTIVVEDTGIGIEPHELQHVFRQFEQASNNKGGMHYGTGLGLSIVKELVEAQNGTIAVQSQPKKGSQFTVAIAYPLTNAPVSVGTNDHPGNGVHFSGTVWIVDDDRLIRNLASLIFSKYNIRHRCFSSAEDLLAAKFDTEVQLIVSDIRLPGMDGIHLCHELRKKIGPGIKIIALTAQVLAEEKQAILENGFDSILLKPFTETALVEMVHEFTILSSPEPASALDLSGLRKLVVDEHQVMAILEQCFEDTITDKKELADAVNRGDLETCSLIIHRLAGRAGQVGEKELAKTLRYWEAELRSTEDAGLLQTMHEDVLPELESFLFLLQSTLGTTV